MRVGFIYVPDIGNVYRVSFSPFLSKYNKWEVFSPFYDLSYGVVDDVELLGSFEELKSESEASYEELTAKWEKEDKESTGHEEISDFWDVRIFWRDDDEFLQASLPADFLKVIMDRDIEKDARPIDVLIIKERRDFNDWDRYFAPDISMRSAIIVKF